MNKMRILGRFALFAGVILVASAAASARQKNASDPLQIARGAKAWSQVCGTCHNYRAPEEFTDKGWDVIVNHMRVQAMLPGQVARDIKAFLKSSN